MFTHRMTELSSSFSDLLLIWVVDLLVFIQGTWMFIVIYIYIIYR
jgi:hypothetical protein